MQGIRGFRQGKVLACATAFAVVLVASGSEATAQFDALIPTKIALVRFAGSPPVGRMYKFVSKAPRGGPFFQLPSSSPATTGGSLTVTIGSGTLGCTFAPGLFNGTVGWKELGNPAGSRGYKYLNKSAPTTDLCKIVTVKEKAIKVIALGTGTIAAPVDYPPGNPDISTVLTLGGDDYCGYAARPHDRERADRYIKAKDEAAPGSCPGVPTTTSTIPSTSTTTPSTTTTTITLACNCCSGSADLLSFETDVASGTCGVLRNFRCSNYGAAACVDDNDCNFGSCLISPPWCLADSSLICTDDSDCEGVCQEVVSGNLPMELECGGAYMGGGLHSMPLPVQNPDRNKFFVRATSCEAETGEMTLGPTTPAEVGTRHCTQGRQCSNDGSTCVMDSDCEEGTCDDLCLFGAPIPMPNADTPATSFCVIGVVAEDANGIAQCDGGDVDLDLPLRGIPYWNGDLFKSSTPPDIPGIQPCPLCDTLCAGGTKADFPCDADSDCPGSTCNTSTECLGGLNDGEPCTPETSDSETQGDPEDAYPTSHDCGNAPLTRITDYFGGVLVDLNLTTGGDEWNAEDRPQGRRNFCGYCRDVLIQGSLCFEGDTDPGCPAAIPAAEGNPVPCTSDADCQADGDAYESCVQRDGGAFSQPATRITVSGSTDGECLADGQPHPADLVSLFCFPPTFDPVVDAANDWPGPGVDMFQGEVVLQ